MGTRVTVTDEERREAARRLRGMAPGSDWPRDVAEACGMGVSAMSGNFHTYTAQLCARLADLIDPGNAQDSLYNIRKDARSLDDGTEYIYWRCVGISCGDCPSRIDGMLPHNKYGVSDCLAAAYCDLVERTIAVMGGEGDE